MTSQIVASINTPTNQHLNPRHDIDSHLTTIPGCPGNNTHIASQLIYSLHCLERHLLSIYTSRACQSFGNGRVKGQKSSQTSGRLASWVEEQKKRKKREKEKRSWLQL